VISSCSRNDVRSWISMCVRICRVTGSSPPTSHSGPFSFEIHTWSQDVGLLRLDVPRAVLAPEQAARSGLRLRGGRCAPEPELRSPNRHPAEADAGKAGHHAGRLMTPQIETASSPSLEGRASRASYLRGWTFRPVQRRNGGAPGMDKLTLDEVEEYGTERFLAAIETELREGRYRPLPARQVLIRNGISRGSGGRWRSRRCETGSCRPR